MDPAIINDQLLRACIPSPRSWYIVAHDANPDSGLTACQYSCNNITTEAH